MFYRIAVLQLRVNVSNITRVTVELEGGEEKKLARIKSVTSGAGHAALLSSFEGWTKVLW